MARPYLEQAKISGFDAMSQVQRRAEVTKYRNIELYRLQRLPNKKTYHQRKKNFEKTEAYIHLTWLERQDFLVELARIIGNWNYARLFAECIDKTFFDPTRSRQTVDEQAFEQIVSRFEQYLQIMTVSQEVNRLGLIIHDNNETSCKRMTELMGKFHERGTFWTRISNIIETPLYVDSKLTSMVQVADLCGFALRRYLEKGETNLFEQIFSRADKKDGRVVGVRHFNEKTCTCQICQSRRIP